MTVSDLRKKLKGISGKLPVYMCDHDHGTYEVNGSLGSVNVLNQKDDHNFISDPYNKDFLIKGKYVALRIG